MNGKYSIFVRSYRHTVHGVIHDVHPALEGGDLKEREISDGDIVEGDPDQTVIIKFFFVCVLPRVNPETTLKIQTDGLVGNNFVVKSVSLRVHTLLELSHEEVDPDDGKYQPEDETDGHDVGDARKGSYQGRDDNLHPLHLGHGSQWSQCSECPHCLEY